MAPSPTLCDYDIGIFNSNYNKQNGMPSAPSLQYQALDAPAVGHPPLLAARRESHPPSNSSSLYGGDCSSSSTSSSSNFFSSASDITDFQTLHRKLDRSTSEPVEKKSISSRYKTELCRPFEENGHCKYGEKCQFAHGQHELRSLTRHPKYKTELCRTFHTSGFCPYGPRCHFVHNAEEARRAAEVAARDEEQRALTILSQLGSTADTPSPPSSVSGSPTSFFDDDCSLKVFSPSQASRVGTSFAYPDYQTQLNNKTTAEYQNIARLAELNHQLRNGSVSSSSLKQQPSSVSLSTATNNYNNALAALNQINDNMQRLRNSQELIRSHPKLQRMSTIGMDTPPSPVDSLASDLDTLSLSSTAFIDNSLLDNLRLPVFNKFYSSFD